MNVLKSTDLVVLPERNSFFFENLAVGEHFYFDNFKSAESARVAGAQFARRRGLRWKFSIRKMRDGWRVFRIE